jgi:cold shock CspA family protein
VASGTITRFNADKGWGFIRPDGGGDDVMLHVRELCDGEDPAWLRPEVRVSYDVRRTDRGLRAANVRTWLETRPRPGSVQGFRDEITEVLSRAVVQIEDIARRHGWV